MANTYQGVFPVKDTGDGKSRYAAAADIARDLSRTLDDRFDVRVRTFSGSSDTGDVKDLAARKPEGQSTDIAMALGASLDPERPQGQAVVLLSDGLDNASGDFRRSVEADGIHNHMDDLLSWSLGVEQVK